MRKQQSAARVIRETCIKLKGVVLRGGANCTQAKNKPACLPGYEKVQDF